MSKENRTIKNEFKKKTRESKLVFYQYCDKLKLRDNLNTLVKHKLGELKNVDQN